MTTVEPGAWQAHHIFYTANSRPIIVECVGPLVAQLRADDLLDGYFFINYWLEGPHLRLRIRPRSEAVADEVRARTEAAIKQFLATRPALYNVKSAFFTDLYNTLFDLEFSHDERQRYLDADGRMRQRDNNTYSAEGYEPEFGKYGGVDGVALAEWHFELSSDLVVRADAALNVHVRSVLLGLGAQLMMVMCSAFLVDPARIRDFLQGYHDFWRRGFEQTTLITGVEYDKAEATMGTLVAERFATIHAARESGELGALPPLLADWMRHCLELRERVVAAAVAGQLRFARWDGPGEEVITDPDAAMQRLLSPYLHMTNNRLQVTLGDEAYLSLVVSRALDRLEAAVPA